MVNQKGKFRWLEEGDGEQPIILLHGLMGGVENFGEMVDYISKKYKVYGLDLKLFEGRNLLKVSVKSLSDYLNDFMNMLDLTSATLIGNSMGGHIALIFAKDHPTKVDNLILTGSSGLFEESMGNSWPRRGDKITLEKTEEVFYDPKVATDELVDKVFAIANNRMNLLKLLGYAKSAIRHNMANEIPNIKNPTCLIWGANDKVTPPHVAEEFHKLLPNSKLYWIDKCGHAAMWEHPKRFSEIVLEFLK